MTGDPRYAARKLRLAVDHMATSRRPIREALGVVLVSHLHVVFASDYPTELLRKRWHAWMTSLTCIEAKGDEGRFRATLHVMSDELAQRLVEDLRDIAATLQCWIERQDQRAPGGLR